MFSWDNNKRQLKVENNEKNMYSNNNTNNIAMNDNNKLNSIDVLGLCMVFHRQYFQMEDLLAKYCQRLMNGLNLCASPCKPPQDQVEINEMKAQPKKGCETQPREIMQRWTFKPRIECTYQK